MFDRFKAAFELNTGRFETTPAALRQTPAALRQIPAAFIHTDRFHTGRFDLTSKLRGIRLGRKYLPYMNRQIAYH